MIKYMHVERLGTDEVEGILDGTVVVMPKLDGTNGQIYMSEDGEIMCASRNKMLDAHNTNQGFWNHVTESSWANNYGAYFSEHPHHILYGEWLVPHTLKTYEKLAWNKFYVFDVFDTRTGLFIPYDRYISNIRDCFINFVPKLADLYRATEVGLQKYVESNKFLMTEGNIGEGIVIKRYDFVNKYGRVCWAKLVRAEFKEEFVQVWGEPPEGYSTEKRIAIKYVTEGRIEKILAKILGENTWSKKYIPQLLGTVWHDVVTEESWQMLKEFHNPTVDFKRFLKEVENRVKELRPELFN